MDQQREQDASHSCGTARLLSNYRSKNKVLHGDSLKKKKKTKKPPFLSQKSPWIYFASANTFLLMQFHIEAHLLCMACPLHPSLFDSFL